MSDDKTLDIAKSFPKVKEIVSFDTGNQLNEYALTEIRNQLPKKYAQENDWVINVDADEFVYCEAGLVKALEFYKNKGVSVPNIHGYEIMARADYTLHPYPEDRYGTGYGNAWKVIFPDEGIFSGSVSKKVIYDPKINLLYGLGKHKLAYCDKHVDDDLSIIKLLHFKHLGLEYCTNRYKQLGKRLAEGSNIGGHWKARENNPYLVPQPYLDNGFTFKVF